MGKSININQNTYDKLKSLKHPGQSLDGVINELIQKVAAKTPSMPDEVDRMIMANENM